jgi:hypothetical protein
VYRDAKDANGSAAGFRGWLDRRPLVQQLKIRNVRDRRRFCERYGKPLDVAVVVVESGARSNRLVSLVVTMNDVGMMTVVCSGDVHVFRGEQGPAQKSKCRKDTRHANTNTSAHQRGLSTREGSGVKPRPCGLTTIELP